MDSRLSRILSIGLCLFVSQVLAYGQELSPTVFTTAPKLALGRLNNVDEVRGSLTFTVTAANSEDTVTGTINYQLADETRQKLADLTGRTFAQVPPVLSKQAVLARFQPATAPPILHLEIAELEFDVLGAKVRLASLTLDITARQGSLAPYTGEEIEALFTAWARQINTGRPRRGIIARMNRVLTGEH